MHTKIMSNTYTWTRQMEGISKAGGEYEQTCRNVLTKAVRWLDAQPNTFLDHTKPKERLCIENPEEVGQLRLFILTALSTTNVELKLEHLEKIVNDVFYIKRNGWKYYERMKQRHNVKNIPYTDRV